MGRGRGGGGGGGGGGGSNLNKASIKHSSCPYIAIVLQIN